MMEFFNMAQKSYHTSNEVMSQFTSVQLFPPIPHACATKTTDCISSTTPHFVHYFSLD